MAHWKNRKPRTWSGCCRMCAHKTHSGGCRNKRIPTIGELRCATVAEGSAEMDCRGGRLVDDAAELDVCDGCEWCDPGWDDDSLDYALGFYTGTSVERGTIAPKSIVTLGDAEWERLHTYLNDDKKCLPDWLVKALASR